MYAYNHYLKKHIENLPKNVVQIWEYAFSEMMNNVIDHSGADMVTITVETNPLTTTVTIKDNGVGIFEKIMNYFSFDTQETAICELFKGKLTTDSKNHSGEGIFFSSKMMDEFFILSDGNTFTTNKYKRSKTEDMEKTEGTCVIMRLSNATKRSTKEIFDMYSNVDEGLTKTVIMIKNIFDTSPVSRSQAKRICYRLDEHFSEVILDFEDVEWMGQGFAHQIFCVFQEEHPDIILTIKNMNEDVRKMYAHVRAEKL
ncbi:MAG: DUF4325 domain-containing protein [Lachnospiraceae bacterium]|nr:DUF4325 domain-containing protein [Lachnospiraceae bacterium]